MLKSYDDTTQAFVDRNVKRYDNSAGAWVNVDSAKRYDNNVGAWVDCLCSFFIMDIGNFGHGGSYTLSENNAHFTLNAVGNGMNDSFSLQWDGGAIVNPVLKCKYIQDCTIASLASSVNPLVSFSYGGAVVATRDLYPSSVSGRVNKEIEISVSGLVDSISIICDPFVNSSVCTFTLGIENLTINDKIFRFKD